MVALVSSNTSFGSTFIASVSIFHPRYIFESCPCSMKSYSSQIWRISTSNWHRAQLAIFDKPYFQGTQRSLLTSQLLCVWLAVSNAHFPVLSRKPSESVKTKISTAHISKTKTNFSKIPSKLFSGLQNLVIEINLSRRFSWPLTINYMDFSLKLQKLSHCCFLCSETMNTSKVTRNAFVVP